MLIVLHGDTFVLVKTSVAWDIVLDVESLIMFTPFQIRTQNNVSNVKFW